MSSEELERRIKVWEALSELFLDTEIDAATYKYIARSVIESGYHADEIRSILWNEVFPVLESNLRDVAGVWEGYPRDWLAKHIRMEAIAIPSLSSYEVAEDVTSSWIKVCEHLPDQYAKKHDWTTKASN